MDHLRQDIIVALRALRRRPVFAAVAIATIALGIGAATAMYGVVDAVLLRPLEFRESGRIVALWQTYPEWRKDPATVRDWDTNRFSIPEYRDLSAATTTFSDVAIWAPRRAMLGRAGETEQVVIARASASLLPVLDVAPSPGRNFRPDEDVVGGAPVAMISREFWQSRYRSDPGVLGTTIRLDDADYTIVGVLPAQLSMSRGSPDAEPVVWVPVGRDARDAARRDNHSYFALARLAPGATLAHAREEAARILSAGEQPGSKGVRVDEWQVDQTRHVRRQLLILFGAAGLLLAIACVNVAILLLGEASAREKEIASRIALGASPSRIVAQLLTESVVLAGIAAAAGTALAWAGTKALIVLSPATIPGLSAVGVDLRVLLFALAVAMATGILFGLAPAVTLAHAAPAQLLRTAGGASAPGRGALQRTLVAAELALSLVLLVGATLLARSLDKLSSVDPGFRADGLLNVRVALSRPLSLDSFATREFYRAASQRLGAVPGVVNATAGQSPFGGATGSTNVDVQRDPGDPPRDCSSMTSVIARTCPTVRQPSVMPGYFETVGIPLLAGRTFTDADRTNGPPVIVISESMAKRDFHGLSPLGRRVRVRGTWREVVGIVGDTRMDKLSAEPEPTVYAPVSQLFQNDLQLLVRSRVDAATVAGPIRDALREIAPSVAFISASPLPELIRRSSAEERYRTTLISVFGVVAALLAAAGMFGVTSRAVSRRTREMGIRMALGATPASVTSLAMGYTLSGVWVGLAAGTAASALASRALAPFLFGVTGTDGVSYAGSVALLGAVAVAASWLPARRAARRQPADIMRSE